MSAEMISALAKDDKLFEDFKKDPINTLRILEQTLGKSMANVSYSDIELIKTFSKEEFQVFVSISSRMNRLGKKNFKI
jgi:hypothetical protein